MFGLYFLVLSVNWLVGISKVEPVLVDEFLSLKECNVALYTFQKNVKKMAYCKQIDSSNKMKELNK